MSRKQMPCGICGRVKSLRDISWLCLRRKSVAGFVCLTCRQNLTAEFTCQCGARCGPNGLDSVRSGPYPNRICERCAPSS